VRDALRLAFGTLTVLPVRAPSRVDRRVAGWAMGLAPAVGAALGVVAAAVAWGLSAALDPPLVAVLVVALLGGATRLIHWDGLADTADGLGSGRPPPEALEVMRRGDVGPFGVLAVVAAFAVQAVALADLLTPDVFFFAAYAAPGELPGSAEVSPAVGGLGALVAALVLGRCALLVACRAGVPAARPEGLGAAVAGSVGMAQAVVGAVLTVVVLASALLLDDALRWSALLASVGVCLLWAVAATAYLRRRLGGMTGDTLGALVETTTAVALVVLSAGG
jgi:adenosylcobinamide-GDP ribazoletransferase